MNFIGKEGDKRRFYAETKKVFYWFKKLHYRVLKSTSYLAVSFHSGTSPSPNTNSSISENNGWEHLSGSSPVSPRMNWTLCPGGVPVITLILF